MANVMHLIWCIRCKAASCPLETEYDLLPSALTLLPSNFARVFVYIGTEAYSHCNNAGEFTATHAEMSRRRSNNNRQEQILIEEKPNDGKLTYSEDIVIVGGGVAGLATALALHRVGLKSIVLERADSLRTTGAAFMMWSNAWRALDALGVSGTLRATFSELEGIEGHSNSSGNQKYVGFKEQHSGNVEARCVERIALLEALANALPQGTIRFNSKVNSIHQENSVNSPFTRLELANGISIRAKMLIGCDGVHSVVAEWMGLQPAKSTGRSACRGMATYPQGHNMDKKMVQIWGKGTRVGYIPCTENQIYWFITQDSVPKDAEMLQDPEIIRRRALKSVAELPELVSDIINRSPGEILSVATLRTRLPWPSEWRRSQKGCATLVGDAVHPMMPDLGQGACTALEDAVVLGRCVGEALKNSASGLEEWGSEKAKKIEDCLKKYLEERKWRIRGVVFGAFVAGIVTEGSSSFLRFVRDRILFPLVSMSYVLYFGEYQCGTLPSTPSTL